jgi:purine-binding chemotaxis protein CheW
MKTGKSVVVFLIEGYRYGIPLEMVERVAPVVEVTPIPEAPDAVLGIVNVRGSVMPVINLRKKLRLPERGLKLSDQLLIIHLADNALAILVDTIEGAMEYDDDSITKTQGDALGQQVLKTDEGIVYIYDYERLLNSQEEGVLKKAMEKVSA